MSKIINKPTDDEILQEMKRSHEYAKRNLWETTLRDSLGRGDTIITALSIADKALEAYDKKFTITK